MSDTPVSRVERLIDDRIEALGTEEVGVHLAAGRVLAAPVRATVDRPRRDRAASDGYAVKSADTPGALELVGQLGPGERFEGLLHRGQAMGLFAGADIPEGADAVVSAGSTSDEAPRIEVTDQASAGQGVLVVGADVAAGQDVLRAGHRLRAQDLALLFAVGVDEVEVRRRPRVRVVRLADGERAFAAAHLVAALAERDGAIAERCPTLEEPAELPSTCAASGADLTVVVGDAMRRMRALETLEEISVRQVALEPGGDTSLAFVNERPVLVLSDDPGACLVVWDLFARAVVQRLLGATVRLPYTKLQADLTAGIDKTAGHVRLVMVSLHETSGAALATPIDAHPSFASTLARADGFVYLRPDQESLASGARVDVYVY